MIEIYSTERGVHRAQKASEFLGLPFEIVDSIPRTTNGFFLWAHSTRLELGYGNELATGYAELKEVTSRLRSGSRLQLARSLGIDKHSDINILDAMSGFGVDAMVMLGLGCNVTMVEQSGVMYVLLCDALERFNTAANVPGNWVTLHTKAQECFNTETQYDVVYLDPMFPVRNKKALPNRRAQLLSQLIDQVETEDSLRALISDARGAAILRVVLKRRRTDPITLEPDWQIVGRSVRYDVYRGLG